VKRQTNRTIAISLGLGVCLGLCLSLYLPVSRRRLDPQPVISLRIEDRNGVLLREVLSDEGGRCRWISLRDISPLLLKATIAAEDRYYFSHPGVNPYAVVRAFIQNLKSRRVVSGASTITQQVIRNIYHFRRNIPAKVEEAWLAVRLEHTLTKDEILVQYLNRVSYGNQAFGVEAAARLYFDKPSEDLSLAEAAFLAALPRSPSELNPYRNYAAAAKRQKDVLRRMLDLKFIDQASFERARAEALSLSSIKEKFRAPHFCDYVLENLPAEARRRIAVIRTTLDYGLQEKAEVLLRAHLGVLELKNITNGAVLVLDNRTAEILAMVGSRDFFDEERSGQVNGALSLRQPGSTLKPLTYALALERGMTAATILDDVPTPFATRAGSYMPENYDEKFHGRIRLRSALASSYNVPAVEVLQTLGPDLLYRRLRDLGFANLRGSPGFYGVGLTLGNGEVTLLELVRAYAALARGGIACRERSVLAVIHKGRGKSGAFQESGAERIFSPQAAFIITHILADKDARIPTFGYLSPLNFPFPAAAKTGTSKDFRDNWTVGYTPRHTAGVWVGNFDGMPMQNVSGVSGAGPIFRDIMLLLAAGRSDAFEEPRDIVHARICPLSGELPSPRCPSTIDEVFIRGSEPLARCSLIHAPDQKPPSFLVRGLRPVPNELTIVVPQEGDVYKIDSILRRDFQAIQLKADVPLDTGIRAVEWWINGRSVGAREFPHALSWNLKPGSYTIQARARTDSRKFESRPVRITVLS